MHIDACTNSKVNNFVVVQFVKMTCKRSWHFSYAF